jgi:hypothetical protein
MKIHLVGTDLFHADGRADMMKLIVIFRNFTNAPKNHEVERRMQNTTLSPIRINKDTRSSGDDVVGIVEYFY